MQHKQTSVTAPQLPDNSCLSYLPRPHSLRLACRRVLCPSRALQRHPASADDCRWLPGARLNIAECCLVGRDPDRPAIVWAEEGRPEVVQSVTLGELSRRSAHVAEALRAAGLRPGMIL